MSNEPTGLPLLAIRIANRIGRPLGLNPFPRAFPNPLAEEVGQAAEVFDEVYRRNYWGSAQSRSGVGSETTFAARYRTGLAALIRSRGFRRVFDAPCGDLNWMAPLIAEAGIDYVGGDISSLGGRGRALPPSRRSTCGFLTSPKIPFLRPTFGIAATAFFICHSRPFAERFRTSHRHLSPLR